MPDETPHSVVAGLPQESRLHVVGWPDPLVDVLGYDPRSCYVEQFWLGVIGPTSTWLLRRFASGLESHPNGFVVDLPDTSRALGVGSRQGAHSPLRRAIARCVVFGLATWTPRRSLAVRRRLPPLARRHLLRLPLAVQELHRQWHEGLCGARTPSEQGRTARRLALELLDLGLNTEEIELRLARSGIHPALAYQSSKWAARLHQTSLSGLTAPRGDAPPGDRT